MTNDGTSESAIHRPTEFQTHVFPLEEKYQVRARDLWCERFGASRDTADKWLNEAHDEDSFVEAFIAVERGRVIGVGVCTLADRDYAEHYIDVPLDGLEPWEKTGILHMLAVDEDHTGEGIGSKLTLARMNYLAAEGAEGVIGVAWHRESHPDSRPLFEKFDFEAVATVEEYYAKTHGRGGHCPDCDGECTCDATIYRRPVA
jgi:GNAT superfamily N-acetyltransferase